VPLVRSPHGSFQPAALDKSALRKRIVGALLERPFLRQAAVVHATAEHEAAAVRAYGARGLVVVVPNAIDPVELDPCAEAPRERIDARCPACRGRRYALVLSRLHPMKGIDLLLASWRRVVSEFPTWHLLIAGPRDGRFERALVRQAAMLQLQGSLTFCGPLFGIDKEAALSHASVLVLPSRSENFGMSVAEALAHGVPVIATRGSPWSGVTGVRGPSVTESFPDGIADGPCGWCVEASVDGLAHALRDALQLDDAARAAMGARGRHWVGRALDSRPLAARMLQAYEACLRHPR
jgi:glycosyltransferase involved in cell wall biosynthesis